MKKIILLITAAVLLCMNVNAKSKKNNKKEVEKKVEFYKPTNPSDSRDVVENQLSQDEKDIYDYVVSVILQQHKTRSNLKTVDGKYEIEKIPVNKVICLDTTISMVDFDKTFEECAQRDKEYFLSKKEGKYEEAFDSFIENNKVRNNISSFLKQDKRIVFTQDVHDIMGEIERTVGNYWTKLYEAVPDSCGELYFSNIGFNKTKTNAIIQIKFISGSMSGYVNYLVFGKNSKNEWEVIDVLTIANY